MLYVETKNSFFNVYISSHYDSELLILQICSRIIALHGGKAYTEYGRFHTIRANQVLL